MALNASQRLAAVDLRNLIDSVLVDHCACVGMISLRTCEEIIEHHERDLLRLKVLHPDGVHPAKHIGYLVFWIRKLKPISSAFHASTIIGHKDGEIPYADEFVTINELVAIYVAQHLLLSYTNSGHMVSDLTAEQRAELGLRIQEILKDALTSRLDIGASVASMFAAFVYDMRYRTFGPHHIVHFINHVVYAALSRGTLSKAAT